MTIKTTNGTIKEENKMNKIYSSDTKGKEEFTKEVLTPVLNQYGFSLASYVDNDGKDEKVFLFKTSNRTVGIIDDVESDVDVTCDSITALFEDTLKHIGIIPDVREKNSLIKACLNYIQSTTEDSNEFLNVMRAELGMTDEEIEEYGKGYCLDDEQ